MLGEPSRARLRLLSSQPGFTLCFCPSTHKPSVRQSFWTVVHTTTHTVQPNPQISWFEQPHSASLWACQRFLPTGGLALLPAWPGRGGATEHGSTSSISQKDGKTLHLPRWQKRRKDGEKESPRLRFSFGLSLNSETPAVRCRTISSCSPDQKTDQQIEFSL